jgi:hypothetical protein
MSFRPNQDIHKMKRLDVLHELGLHGMARGMASKRVALLRNMLKTARSLTDKTLADGSADAPVQVARNPGTGACVLDSAEEDDEDERRSAYDSDASVCSELDGFTMFAKRRAPA